MTEIALRLLVVEDDPDLNRQLTAALSDAGYVVDRAFDGEEGHFLGDSEPWKLEWTSTTRAHDWLFVFAGTPRGRLMHPLKFQLVPFLRCTSQPFRA